MSKFSVEMSPVYLEKWISGIQEKINCNIKVTPKS